MLNTLQYTLWTRCNNHCFFCYYKNEKNPNEIKILKQILELVKSGECCNYNRISLIGGELFDNKFDDKTRCLFYEIIDYIIKSIKNNNNKCNQLLIMTNLIYDYNIELKEFIDYVKENEILDKILICSSYDTMGRFTDSRIKLFNNNFRLLKEIGIKTHLEVILTQHFLESVLEDNDFILKLKEKYTENIDYVVPHTDQKQNKETFIENKLLRREFFPKRKTFLSFLEEVYITNEIQGINKQSFLCKENHSSTLYYIEDGELKKENNRLAITKTNLGSLPQDKLNYIDNDDVNMYQDLLTIKNLIC